MIKQHATQLAIAAIAGLSLQAPLAQAQSIAKVKGGDRLVYESITYNAKGREVVVDSTRSIEASITEKDAQYTTTSELGVLTYLRAGHMIVERTIPNGPSGPVPDNQRVSWLPAGGDFSKPYAGSFVITNPSCGQGKLSFEATPKVAKYSLMISGKMTELDVQEIQIDGRWIFGGQCGSGKQIDKVVYSPALDFLLERDTKSYLPNGFLNRGSANKLKSIN